MKLKKKINKMLAIGDEYSPKKVNIETATFSSTTPISKDESDYYEVSCMEWKNGEGYELIFTKNDNVKLVSLLRTEVDNLVACLNELNYFEK